MTAEECDWSRTSPEKQSTTSFLPKAISEDPRYPVFVSYAKAVGGVLGAIFACRPWFVICSLGRILRTVLGVGLGIGLGGGLALHIFQQLQAWQTEHDRKKHLKQKVHRQRQLEERIANSRKQLRQKASLKGLGGEPLVGNDAFSPASSIGDAIAVGAEDGDSYVGLMAQAGYPVHDRVLRGQILKGDHEFWKILYKFTDETVPSQRGVRLVSEEWPGLPRPVTRELGRFIEHVMRDFVSSWYSLLDPGILFSIEKEKRDAGILRDGLGKKEEPPSDHRRMVFSTMTHRRAPMIDCCYTLMSSVIGNLATRVEHVNLLELVLLKWTQVLGQTLNEYRNLRKMAQEKKAPTPQHAEGSSTPKQEAPSEVEVTREFLLAGKLHRAITFGLDVPSLLFADASGEEFGLGTEDLKQTSKDPTKVFEHRLYETNILRECQIDYNRVLANRLVRALMPKSETASHCVVAMLTEIIGVSVLTPVMNLWVPNFLNEIIVKLLTTSPSNANEERTTSAVPETPEEIIVELSESERDIVLSSSAERSLSNDSQTNEIESSSAIRKAKPSKEPTNGEKLLKLGTMALRDLQKYMDFDRCRKAKRQNGEDGTGVDWDNADCQNSALKLAMVIEAALLDGRCPLPDTLETSKETEVFPDLLADETNAPQTRTPTSDVAEITTNTTTKSFVDLLMEMTGDMDAFEKQVDELAAETSLDVPHHDRSSRGFEPERNEIALLRTLICSWLHTGEFVRVLRLIVKGVDAKNVFAPYFAETAFLSTQGEGDLFFKHMQVLEDVEVMVETMAVRVFPKLIVSEEYDLLISAIAAKEAAEVHPTETGVRDAMPAIVTDTYQYFGHQSTPRYLDFQRNEAFAASLRAERKRRWRAWETRKMEKDVHIVIRKTASSKDCELHSEMHNLARLFYNGTTIMTVRDAARKRDSADEKVSLMTVEIVSSRRRIEVPDDDSSFLLRAQSRQLNPVSVHLDDRNHDMGYKCFLATYEEPAVSQSSTRYSDGRYVRRCFLQYYPSDRTARIVPQNDARKLDKRKGIGSDRSNDIHGKNSTNSNGNNMNSPFSRAFLNQRYLCQKIAASQSFMSSSLMEPSDFNAFPRTGKALDFVYRMSLFDRPVVDLAGKQFQIQDSSNRGVHRADASSFEVSDASLSYVLLKIGKDHGSNKHGEGKGSGAFREVETGPDGYPVLFLRYNKLGEQTGMEFKPYRLSFVRAALLVSSARQEAQLDSLIECVKAGSAKSATKARTEARLRPVKKMLYFASDRSDQNVNQDLKLGQFLDRGQLQRNGLLNLRHPTTILQLFAKVEGFALAKDVPLASSSNKSYNADTVLYRIRCTAVVELVDAMETTTEFEPYALDDGSFASVYREEFVVHRSMTEFQTLHKQLKSEVALTESTMSTSNRIVGVASAALGTQSLNRRNKKILIPSLAQASKIGALGMTKKLLIKRMELLDEYICYLLASNSLMNRCSELLLFLGASHPFPPEVTMTKSQGNIKDLLGRTNFVRSIALRDGAGGKLKTKKQAAEIQRRRNKSNKAAGETTNEMPAEAIAMDPTILNKVDQIPLAEVRNRFLELIRLSFSFENASFMRSQLLAALETASFLAVAKQSDFRRVLHDIHVNHMSGEAVGRLIETLLDILWPDGVWMQPAPLPTYEEEVVMRDTAKVKLHEKFPDQVRTLLGKEMIEDGLDMIHEMLQNRVVVKSLFYMLLDLLWIELFPELRDTLPCASALDLDLL